jgi:hypothetical protein
MKKLLCTIIAAAAFAPSLALALANNPPVNAAIAPTAFSFLSSREMWMAVLVLLSGVGTGVFCVLLTRSKIMEPEQVIRITALLLIVTGTLLLVATGYDANQIAPALGLLGTIAGYLLGRSDSVKEEKIPEPEKKDKADGQ